MFSLAKKEDKEFLVEVGELVKLLVKIDTPAALQVAEKYGEEYLALENRIKTYDYKREDHVNDLLADLFKNVPLCRIQN